VSLKKRLIKGIFALLLIAGLFYFTSFEEVFKALLNLTPASVLLLLLVSLILIWISVIKWGMLLRELGGNFTSFYLGKLYLLGYFVNSFLPSQVGGDLLRSVSIGKTLGHDRAFAATILERYTGIVAMSVLAFITMWCVHVPPLIRWLVFGFVLGVAAATIVALSRKALVILVKIGLPAKYLKLLLKIQRAFRIIYSKPWIIVKALLLSFLYHTFTVVNTAICAAAVGWHNVSLLDLFTVLPLILLVGALPLTPSSLGIQEGAFYFFLQMIGATRGQALGIAVILRAKGYFLASLGGIVFFSRTKSKDAAQFSLFSM
jgi:uncharacterized protein (TIRG00374 family)